MAQNNDPLATVGRLFDAFRRGDLDALIETVHPQARWTYFGTNANSTKAELVGKASVRLFYDEIINRLETTAFDTREFIVQGQTVVVFGTESWTVKASGQRFHREWTQKYVVQEDLITRMVEYNIQVEPRT